MGRQKYEKTMNRVNEATFKDKIPLANRVPKKGYKGESKWSVVKSLVNHLETLGYCKGTRQIVSRSITEYLQNNPGYKEATKTTISDHYQYLKQRPNLTGPGNLMPLT